MLTLNHKVVDDPVKDSSFKRGGEVSARAVADADADARRRTRVVAALGELEEVLARLWSVLRVQFDRDDPDRPVGDGVVEVGQRARSAPRRG